MQQLFHMALEYVHTVLAGIVNNNYLLFLLHLILNGDMSHQGPLQCGHFTVNHLGHTPQQLGQLSEYSQCC